MCQQPPTAYRDQERRRQSEFKRNYSGFTEQARSHGLYRGKQYNFVLPEKCSSENLYEGIRSNALTYFQDFRIKFWGGKGGCPTNHMCSSQIACLNLLYPSALDKDLAKDIVLQLDSEVETVIPIENRQYIAFEWRDESNLLQEPGFNSSGLRGQLSTSVDAAIYYSTTSGNRNLLLMEWKYTEQNSTEDARRSGSKTDRRGVYEPPFFQERSPLLTI